MKKFLLNAIRSSSLVKAFMKAPMPSWIVLSTDIVLVLISTLTTYFLNPEISTGHTGILLDPWVKAFLFTALLFLAMLIYKPYKSIVRLSAFEDTYRIFSAIGTSAVAAFIIDLIIKKVVGYNYFGTWNIFTICFISFALLVASRIVIKSIFSIASAADKDRKRVILLGSAINSYAVAVALKNEVGGQFDPVLLLSQSEMTTGVIAGSIPIRPYNPDTVGKLFEEYNCDTLIFLSNQMEFIRQEAADVFLQRGIKLLMLNQIEEFNVGHEDGAPILSPHVQNIRIEDLLGRPPIVTEKGHIKDRLHGQTIMITGAAGSIGSEIVRQVASFGAGKIILVDQAETPMHDMQLEMGRTYPEIDIELCIADVANHNRMESIFKEFRPRIVYHAAAYKHVPMMECNPSEAATTNILGTKNLTDLALKYNVEKFVMISTDKAVNPTNVMGATKRVAEIYVQSLANHLRKTVDGRTTKFITTRFGNVLGSNGSVIPLFRRQIESGGPITVTHRDIIRYFMTIPEACSLVLEAGCMGQGGEIFIFDMGKPVKIYDLATRMISLAGLRPNIDIKIVETGLRPGEKLYEELLNDRELTMATHHKKIMIAKVRQYDYEEVCRHLERLAKYVSEVNFHDIVAEIKHIVPEYISKNSKWGTVDSEVSQEENIKEIVTE